MLAANRRCAPRTEVTSIGATESVCYLRTRLRCLHERATCAYTVDYCVCVDSNSLTDPAPLIVRDLCARASRHVKACACAYSEYMRIVP